MKYATIITSINPVNQVILDWLKTCQANDGELVVVGDVKTPSYDLPGCVFLSYEHQVSLDFESSRVTPPNSYARKNLGYLWSFSNGVPMVYETDDDNAPLVNWALRIESIDHTQLNGQGWLNIYRQFGEHGWPRGYPLTQIKSQPARVNYSRLESDCPIQQGMIRGDSDVDAIYRMTNGGDLSFDNCAINSLNGLWCPFNSQSTWWWPKAYLLMYLPTTCPMRVTDIWRSFVAQRCLRAIGKSVVYHTPAEVVQKRNSHNLLNDFHQEIGLYLHAETISNGLDALNLGLSMEENMLQCYDFFITKGLLHKDELITLNAWTKDCKNFGVPA